MVTHYGYVDRGNESEPWDDWIDPICGVKSEDADMTDKQQYVTCKRCLKLLNKHTLTINQPVGGGER